MSTWRLEERESCVSILKSYFQVNFRNQNGNAYFVGGIFVVAESREGGN